MYKQSNLDEKQLARLHTKVWGVGWVILPPPHQVPSDPAVLSLAGSSPWEEPLGTYLWDEARLGHVGGWHCLPVHVA